MRVIIHFVLHNVSRPFQKREILFDKSYRVANVEPNALEFLVLLPLDLGNHRIAASVLGTVTQDIRKLLEVQVVDPFGRSGMKK